MEKDFLLNSELAKELYKSCASGLPVIDYHNHLSLKDLEENRRFENLYDLWIAPDPYKHRAMRMCGVPEERITGGAPAEEKFMAWCEIFPRLAGSPLYQWSLMELEEILEIREIPNRDTGKSIWRQGEGYMARNVVSAKSILQHYRVEYLSPCVSLLDNPAIVGDPAAVGEPAVVGGPAAVGNAVAVGDPAAVDERSAIGGDIRIRSSWRGDNILDPDAALIRRLEELTGVEITDWETYFQAVGMRMDVFVAAGCIFADHSLDDGFRYCAGDGGEEARFRECLENIRQDGGMSGEKRKERGEREPVPGERQAMESAILRRLGREYARRGMVLQLHMGARRYTSTRLRRCAGAAGGYAAVGNSVDMASLTRFLDDVESDAGLPKVILFPLNPADHGMIAALAGSYARDNVAGLVTQGPAWWWCDHGYGIRSVLENTAAYGLLANFPGMTTDSRSFLSFVRHDYFRRILCSWLADRVRIQDIPGTPAILEMLIHDMCYGNAGRMIAQRNENQRGE